MRWRTRCCPGRRWAFCWAACPLPAMSLGGFLAGIATASSPASSLGSAACARDATFAAAYLTAMALGVLIVSMRGSAVDLMNILFGAILAVDDTALILVVSTATVTLIGSPPSTGRWSSNASIRASLAAMGIRGRSTTIFSWRSRC